jgi:hypothetical protein
MIENKKVLDKYNRNTRKINKKHKKNNKNYNNIYKSKKTKKNIKNIIVQKGGEVQALDDVDYSKFGVSKYINANVDWGIMPGAPPMDCVIL